MNYALLAISWIVFYTLHSLLAASKLKRILEVKWRISYKWYRLTYSLISLVLFLLIMIQAMLIPKTIVIPKGDLTDYLGYMFAAIGTMIAIKSSKNYSIKQFLGFKPSSEINEVLVTQGIYSKIRHPLYAGIVLIFLGYLLFAGSMTALFNLCFLLLYLPFGIYFEEKKLVMLFGEAYLKYKAVVPALLPKL